MNRFHHVPRSPVRADTPGPRHQPGLPRQGQGAEEPLVPPFALRITLPADCAAFCMHYQDRYLSYTRVRIGDAGLSRTLVETALGSVAANWSSVLASHRPAAEAWNILGSLIAQAVRAGAAAKFHTAVYRSLPPLQADVFVLRHRLSLSDEQAADLMGVDESLVASQLRMTHRIMARHLVRSRPAVAPD